MQTAKKTAVLLLAHGSPDTVEEIPNFLLSVTGGRPVPPPVIKEVQHRYGLIGRSPLTELTLKQGTLLQRELGTPVYIGMRNWKPWIADTVRQMIADEVQQAIVICLAPQASQTSVGKYRSVLMENAPPFEIDFVESWHDHPMLIKAFSEKLLRGLRALGQESSAKIPVIFTAHSVPQREDSNVYEAQAKQTAALVAQEADLQNEAWTFAFQSQGMSGGPWLGPTVEDTILRLQSEGHIAVFVQPIGFLCDHVEVLYDIDIGFKQFAEKQGLQLSRAESLNDSPSLTAALADIARARMQQAAQSAKSF
jgi:protoporphyrin/coproporphyrin ferrochelatase